MQLWVTDIDLPVYLRMPRVLNGVGDCNILHCIGLNRTELYRTTVVLFMVVVVLWIEWTSWTLRISPPWLLLCSWITSFQVSAYCLYHVFTSIYVSV